MRTTIPSGQIAGVALRTHWTTLVAIIAVVLSLIFFPLNSITTPTEMSTSWLLALGVGIILYGSLVLHELGHIVVARSLGLEPRAATLFPLGAISNVHERAATAVHEGTMAAVGPMINVGLGVLFGIAGALLVATSQAGAIALEFLGIANLLLALANLYPGLPLDGGRLFRALVWFLNGARDQGTRFALASGLVAPWILMGAGIVLSLGNLPLGLWLFLGGLSLALVCGRGYRKAVTAEEDRAAR